MNDNQENKKNSSIDSILTDLENTSEENKETSDLQIEDEFKNDEKQIQWLKEEAQKGSSIAMYNLAIAYKTGNGVDKNFELAFQWFKGAASDGIMGSQYNLALCYYYGEGTELDFNEAYNWFLKVAKKGHPDAQANLAFIYENGLSREIDSGEAFYWYNQAATQDQPLALYKMGYFYEMGIEVAKDAKRAVSYYEKACEKESLDAMYRLALCYEIGNGIEMDYHKAFELYKTVALKDRLEAILKIAKMYYDGKGVDVDYKKSIEWYKKAVKLGGIESKYEIAFIYTQMNDLDINKTEQYQYLKNVFYNFVKHESVNFALVARVAMMISYCSKMGLGCKVNDFEYKKYEELEKLYLKAIDDKTIDFNKVRDIYERKSKTIPVLSIAFVSILILILIGIFVIVVFQKPFNFYRSYTTTIRNLLLGGTIESSKEFLFWLILTVIIDFGLIALLVKAFLALIKCKRSAYTIVMPLISLVMISAFFYGALINRNQKLEYSVRYYNLDNSLIIDDIVHLDEEYKTDLVLPQTIENKIFVGWKNKNGEVCNSLPTFIYEDIELYPTYIDSTFSKEFSCTAFFNNVTGKQASTFSKQEEFDLSQYMVLKDYGYRYYITYTTSGGSAYQEMSFEGGHITEYSAKATVRFNDDVIGSVSTKVAANWFSGGSDDASDSLSPITKRVELNNTQLTQTLSIYQSLTSGDRETYLYSSATKVIVQYQIFIYIKNK